MRHDSPFAYFWTYMRRGATYATGILNIVNFSLLGFDIIAVQFFGCPSTFSNLLVFMLFATAAVSFAFMMVGRWDTKKGTAPLEHELFWTINPAWAAYMEMFKLHLQGKDAEALEAVEKWLRKCEDYKVNKK